MLQLRLGTNSQIKLRSTADAIKSSLDKGLDVIALIPDQFSFEFDNAMYSVLGAKTFNRVKTISFKRLAREIISEFGTKNGVLMTQEQRLVIIYLSLLRAKKECELEIFSKQLEKPGFIKEIAEVIDSLSRSMILPEKLSEGSKKISGTLSSKLRDISKIYSVYCDEIKKRNLRDESSELVEATRLAIENGYFNCKAIYVDRFDSFSQDELMMVEAMISSSALTSVALSLPQAYKSSKLSPYSIVFSTKDQLVNIANKLGKQVDITLCKSEKKSTESIECVKQNIFTSNQNVFSSDGSVKIVCADTVYEEADFVSAKILELCEKEGYSFNDIAIFTHDLDTYKNVIEASFERYGITGFIDSGTAASSMSIAIYALSVIDAASTRKPDTEKILNFARSPFSYLSEREISLIEDYCVRWNVDGNMWLEEFKPDTDIDPFSDIESIREKIIRPIVNFREASKEGTAKKICIAFNKLLEDIRLGTCAKSVIDDKEESQKVETARLFKQLWNVIMSSVSSIYLFAGDTPMTIKTFGELLKTVLNSHTISNPPQKLQSVKLCEVTRSIVSDKKVAFCVGLNDGKFPCDISKTGIFNSRDLAVLESIELLFEPSMITRIDSERLDCLNTFSIASDRLYFTYSNADIKGKTSAPSQYIRKISKLLSIDAVTAKSYPLEFYCKTPASAYYQYATARQRDESELLSVYESLIMIPEYKEKLRFIRDSKIENHRLSPQVSKELFTNPNIFVTPSKIDTYSHCNFMYFCKYGLGLSNVRPMAVDPASRGDIMHYVFEKILMHFGESFENATDDEIRLEIKNCLEKYLFEKLGGNFGKTAKFKADYNRIENASLEILLNIREEFKVSKFRPVRFEYRLAKQGGGTVLQIPITKDVEVCIYGIVDRVDTFTSDDGKTYLRIVDYKTGSKQLNFEDIYNGVNLQMLLYMLALTEGTDPDFKDCVPAGVLYVNSVFLKCTGDFDPISEASHKKLASANSQFKRTGLLVEDMVSLTAMDEQFSGNYAPISINKDGSISKKSDVISKDAFKNLEKAAQRRVESFGNSLLLGKIDAIPLGRNDKELPCRYCEFTSVCDRKKYIYKLINKEDELKLMNEIGLESEAKEDEVD